MNHVPCAVCRTQCAYALPITDCALLLWGLVKFHTGGEPGIIGKSANAFCAEQVRFLHRRYSPEGKREDCKAVPVYSFVPRCIYIGLFLFLERSLTVFCKIGALSRLWGRKSPGITITEKVLQTVFKVIPHNSDGAITPPNFSSNETKSRRQSSLLTRVFMKYDRKAASKCAVKVLP